MHQTPKPQERSDAIDFSVLDELRLLDGREPDLVAEVVQLFLADGPQRVEAIGTAAARGEALELGRSAHGLKGSAANVGAVRLRALCERLEHLGKSGNIPGTSSLLAELEAEYLRVHAALEPLIRRQT